MTGTLPHIRSTPAMFDVSQIGRVNARRIDGHDPETLLVVAPGCAKKLSRGWNLLEAPDGSWRRVADAAGNPPFLLVEMTAADLAGVTVDDCDPDPGPEPVVVEAG